MKMPQAFLACFCLLGATQLAWSQVKAPTPSAIPGYLDPKTGKFTTQVASPATAQPNAQGEAALTGTSIFFREDFQFTVQNYDQSGNATAVCSVEIGTSDSNGVSFSDTASAAAIQTGSGWSCDVPVLTLWTLQNPTYDTIYAYASITIYTQATPVPIGRTSSQSYSLAVPSNGQTVVNAVKFQL